MVKRDWLVPVSTPTGIKTVKVGPCVDRKEAAEHAKVAFGKGASVKLEDITRIDPVPVGSETPAPVEEPEVPFTDFTQTLSKEKSDAKQLVD